VLYVLDGDVVARGAGPPAHLPRGHGWHSPVAIDVIAGATGATLLRYELLPAPAPTAGAAAGVSSEVLLEHAIDLDATRPYLMRCDRVDFEPGGVAPPHRHRGGGIRCLLRGRLEVTVADGAPRVVTPGEAWFESGREPVRAVASRDAETSFIRFAILPAEVRGQSSIRYVDPADAARGRPRRYTVHVDEPIALPPCEC
jgi:quercetin dioxygenase-like cupin family protein